MPPVRLLPIDAAVAETLAAGQFELQHGATVSDAEAVQRAVDQMLAMPSAAPAPWCGYLAVDASSQGVVGTCAFRGAPSADGAVEIAYWTFGPFEGRGYAKSMARALVEVAAAAPEVAVVVAHTLPEPNASTRVLTAAGFTFVGNGVDPDDGPVWRWALRLR